MNEELIERHRYINVDDSWWYKDILRSWVVKLSTLGIDVTAKDIHFSGFASQGDGACFEGHVDLPEFVKAHGLDYPYITLAGADGLECRVVLTHSGNYYHGHSVSFDLLIDEPDYIPAVEEELKADLRHQVMLAAYEHDALRFNDLENAVKDICRGYMRDIYRELEKEYDYRTSDEVVWEALVANEMTEELS